MYPEITVILVWIYWYVLIHYVSQMHIVNSCKCTTACMINIMWVVLNYIHVFVSLTYWITHDNLLTVFVRMEVCYGKFWLSGNK